ncbi:MAG: HzsA-related protein [Limisphaerales bacterium]
MNAAAAGQVAALSQPRDQELSSGGLRKQVEDDWLKQAPSAGNYPTIEWVERGRRLAADLATTGVATQNISHELEELAQSWRALPPDASDKTRRELYLQARRQVRRLAFSNPLLDFDRLLFVKRFTQEAYADVCLNHMPWVSRPGGDLCVLSAGLGNLSDALAEPSKCELSVRNILNRALGPGHVHGMDLRWDGKSIVFGYARAKSEQPPEGWLDRSQSYRLRRTEEPTHIFEIGIDGQNLRQITSGEWSDLDPTYAPNGDIVFVSERCGTSLQCNEYDKDETSCNLYVMKADGSSIRRMSVSKDGDYLPHTLDDGTIGYTRWEYHERSWAFIQSLWTVRPDGTGADAIFKQHFANPWSLEDVRSIPGSKKLVCIAAGHHTLAMGPLVVVDTTGGINEPKGISIVTPGVKPPEGTMDGVPVPGGGVKDGGGYYSTPWALSEKYFLVSYSSTKTEIDPTGYALYLVDVFGNKELVYRDPKISCFIPVPLRARQRPPVLPDTVKLSSDSATCVVSDASFGCDGIAPEQVRYIRISEPIGWPYDNEHGGQRYGEDHRYPGAQGARKNLVSWTPIRILGDVPVERDGSAHFKVPADTAVYFQLLDQNRMELRRMRSFISFQPGEVRACVGCHESRGISPPSKQVSIAANRAPSEPTPPPWGDRAVSFLRDVQPVLDRNCVSCHSGLKPAGGLDFCGGLTSHDEQIAGYGYNRAYETILEKELISMSRVRVQDASVTPPLAYGSHKSKLISALSDKPHATEVRMSEEDRLRLVMWIDANAPYHDRFINKRSGKLAYDLAEDRGLKKQIMAVHQRRCASCHKAEEISRLDWIDFRRPERSLFLTAPLAKQWGGLRRCPEAVYRDTNDRDYCALRQMVAAAVTKAHEAPRRDLQ